MFSVVIATRDRPDLLARALRSVAAQDAAEIEVLLVDDSASAEARVRNAGLFAEIGVQGQVIPTEPGDGGLGPGAARNRGIEAARQPYLAFLDDDDEWIDPAYLSRAARTLERFQFDMLFADQVAVRADGSVVPGPIWAEDLPTALERAGIEAADGVFSLTPEQVLLSDGFAHLNTTVLRRAFAHALGGFDAAIRYEEDRDFYLRAIDAAGAIGYCPLVVARHYVPQARASASSIAKAQKDACRLAVLTKATEARSSAIRARARRDRSFTLQSLTAQAVQAGDFAAAARHARAALRDRFSAKWAAYLVSLYLRSAISRRSQAS